MHRAGRDGPEPLLHLPDLAAAVAGMQGLPGPSLQRLSPSQLPPVPLPRRSRGTSAAGCASPSRISSARCRSKGTRCRCRPPWSATGERGRRANLVRCMASWACSLQTQAFLLMSMRAALCLPRALHPGTSPSVGTTSSCRSCKRTLCEHAQNLHCNAPLWYTHNSSTIPSLQLSVTLGAKKRHRPGSATLQCAPPRHDGSGRAAEAPLKYPRGPRRCSCPSVPTELPGRHAATGPAAARPGRRGCARSGQWLHQARPGLQHVSWGSAQAE